MVLLLYERYVSVRKIILSLEENGWYCGNVQTMDGMSYPIFSENALNKSHYIMLLDEEDNLVNKVKENTELNFSVVNLDIEKDDIVKDRFLSIDSFHKYGINQYTDNLLRNRPVYGNA